MAVGVDPYWCGLAKRQAEFGTEIRGLVESLVLYFLWGWRRGAWGTGGYGFYRVSWSRCFWPPVHRLPCEYSPRMHRRTPRSPMGTNRSIRPNSRPSIPRSRLFLAIPSYAPWNASVGLR